MVTNRRTVMTLFTLSDCPYCQRVRIAMAEKGIACEIVEVERSRLPEELIELNPYQSLPTLADRDLTLYGARLILEYVDERYPHPPLMPIDPVNRAKARLAMYRIERDWFGLLPLIRGTDAKAADQARKTLRDSLTASAEVFAAMPYFLSEEFSLNDCYLLPLLWRLPSLGVELPRQAKAVEDYAQRLFAREAFRASLTATERELRP